MTIYDVFKAAIELGIEHDLRPRAEVLAFSWHETVTNAVGDSFVNPYPDSGVVWVDSLEKEVRRVALGVDIEEPELTSVREWERENEKMVDLFIGHHPQGRPLGQFPTILKTQLGNLASIGVATNALAPLYDKQVAEERLEILSENVDVVRDSAALLKCDYLSLHTPIDNLSAWFVGQFLREKAPATLGECREALLGIPEYAAIQDLDHVGPAIALGESSDPLGRFVLTEFVGGEEGPVEVYPAMKAAGIETLITMHSTPEALEEIAHEGLRVIAAGHTGSDSVGLNLFADHLAAQGIEVVPVGGFVRCLRV